jgi:hypothetical protein
MGAASGEELLAAEDIGAVVEIGNWLMRRVWMLAKGLRGLLWP